MAGLRRAPEISRHADTNAVMNHGTHGVALRLTRDEFETRWPVDRSSGVLGRAPRPQEGRDGYSSYVDLGPVDDMIAEGVAAFSTAFFLSDVPDHARHGGRRHDHSACRLPAEHGSRRATSPMT